MAVGSETRSFFKGKDRRSEIQLKGRHQRVSPCLDGMGQTMSSLAPECNDAKKEYDDCFTAWYDKFLRGESNTNECQGKFDTYRTCVAAALAKNGPLKRNLEEAREEAPYENGGAPKSD